jgi:hypothetical protein
VIRVAVAVHETFEVIPRNFAAVVEIRERVLNSWASEADPSLVAAALAVPEASEADPSFLAAAVGVPEASEADPSFMAAAVAIPEASEVIPSFVVKVAVTVLVASEVVFASRPIAITVKPTLTTDCLQLTIVVD